MLGDPHYILTTTQIFKKCLTIPNEGNTKYSTNNKYYYYTNLHAMKCPLKEKQKFFLSLLLNSCSGYLQVNFIKPSH